MKTFPLYYKIKIIFILEVCSNWNCQWKKFREDYFLYKIRRKTKCFKDKELKGIFPALVVFFQKMEILLNWERQSNLHQNLEVRHRKSIH